MSDPHPTDLSSAPDESDAVGDPRRRLLGLAAMSAALLAACGGGGGGSPAPAPPPSPPPAPPPPVVPVDGPPWLGFARNAQHSALSGIASLPLTRLIWSTPVDLAPPYNNGALLAHYGSPVITRYNTVIVPVKTSGGTAAGFRVDARIGANGQMIWSQNSDYRLPPYAWVPSFNPAQAPDGPLYIPDSGGRLLVREDPDNATGVVRHLVFYGDAAYDSAPATCDATIFINTPLTTDSQGNVFFGYVVTGANPAGLAGGGIARIGADGVATWVAAATAAADATMTKTQTNSAPALSGDERTLYVVVNNVPAPGTRAQGRLLALGADTLAAVTRRVLLDPLTGAPAWVNDNATSSPLVGPDGDVYIGVLESNPPAHGFRGWLLHFDATLATPRTPGSFGWDNTPSIVPRAMLPQYTGPSSYLLCCKYNSYGGTGPAGDGRHRVAILDPGQGQVDAPFSGATVMREIISILGITPDPNWPGGVKEWCINTAAVDPFTRSVLMNSEDGVLYRWHLPTNSFTESLPLNNGYAQSYTPTAIGPDGRVYTVNNARLFSVGV